MIPREALQFKMSSVLYRMLPFLFTAPFLMIQLCRKKDCGISLKIVFPRKYQIIQK